MKSVKQIFQLISYLQYPAMIIALYALIPYFEGIDHDLESLNRALVFVGLGISLSTLQDPAKKQNKLFELLGKNPTKSTRIISFLSIVTFLILVLGVLGFFSAQIPILNELFFGLILLGVGLIGFLKSALDAIEYSKT